MRVLPLTLSALLLLAACDGGEAQHAAGPVALRYFAATDAGLLRADASALTGPTLAAPGFDVQALLDSLGLQPDEVLPIYVALEAPTNAPVRGTAVLPTRLAPDVLDLRATRATGRAGMPYGEARVFTRADGYAIALRDRDVLVAPSTREVHALLDRYATGAASLFDAPDVVRLVGRLDGAPLGFVTREPGRLLAALLPDSLQTDFPLALPISHAALRVPPQDVAAETALHATLWLHPADGTSLDALTSLVSALRGLAAASPDLDPRLAGVLAAMQISPDAPDVRLDLTLPFDAFSDVLSR